MHHWKNRFTICIAFMLMLLSVPCSYVGKAAPYMSQTKSSSDDMRACWISYIDIQACLAEKKEAAFRAKVNTMYDRIKKRGMNTVIVHARAMGDAFYPSAYFPYSEYLSKDRLIPGYDPYKIMVELAHEKGLAFHAWVNPYRISIGEETTESFQKTSYYNNMQTMLLSYDGEAGTCLMLDPQNENARTLIINQVVEILERYPVDGIHFDDYFYVDGMKQDISVEEKQEAVNRLIKPLYAKIKEINPDCVFGISPAGNPDYARMQGADIDRWLSEDGYVDYVMPQIYWTDRYKTEQGIVNMFSDRLSTWKNMRKNKTKLYVGLALYRAKEESDTDLGWAEASDNLANQCASAYAVGFDGFSLFRYAYLEIEDAQVELDNLQNYLKSRDGEIASCIEAYVIYASHMQTYGWQTAKTDGIVSGSTLFGKQIEAVRICLGKLAENGNVSYRVTMGDGTTSEWVSNGELCGSVGMSNPITGISIQLTGEIADAYSVYYRVYQKKSGWSNWFQNGDMAGKGIVYALQVKLVKNN